MILVSACLLGLKTRYDGRDSSSPGVMGLVGTVPMVPVCPEQLGGLPTPRPAVEIKGGDGRQVLEGCAIAATVCGCDLTDALLKGAEQTALLTERMGIKTAILKERSPSCGSKQIYDGSFSGKTTTGPGVTTALLREKGVAVFSEEQYTLSKQGGSTNVPGEVWPGRDYV